jgi:hypothetical protein
MALSRKRRKELNRLKGQAEDLWEDQKEVLEHASKVLRAASRQAAGYAREEVSPRVREAAAGVGPAVASGLSGARSAVHNTRERFADEVLPAVTSAIGSALAAVEVAKNKQVRDAIRNASKFGTDVGRKVGVVKVEPTGPGRYILMGLGVVVVAAVAYAAWQTLRADDDLWIDDEPEPRPVADLADES